MASTPNVCTINVRSWGNKKELVCSMLASESVGILAIQETMSTPYRQVRIPQFQTYQKHSEQRSGGVALAISHRLPSRPLAIPPEHALQNAIAATVIWQGKTVNIYSIYIRPQDRLPISFLRYASQNPPAIVLGDLNARHVDFGDHATNTNGRNLLLALDSCPLIRLGCTDPTLINHNGHSIIDHIILTEDLVDDLLPDATIGAPVASDHLPVVGKAALPQFQLPEARRMRAWSHAKWDELVAQVQRATDRPQDPIANTQELEHRVSELTEIIETAIEENVPTRIITPRSPALPPDLMHLVREKRRLYRTLKRTNDPVIRTTWNRLVAITRRKIREHREKEWRNITATLDYRDGKKFWNLLNRLTGRKAAPKYPLQAGIKPLTDAEKSEVLANALLESSRLEDQLFDEPFREAVTEEIDNLRLADSHPPVNEPITAEEIAETIAGQKKNSAPGKDGITWALVRRLPESAIEWLREIYNACLIQGHFPRTWKVATVLMFGKPGKDPTLPSSYRPISLLPVIGKLFEKLILTRIRDHCTEHNTIPLHQYGFTRTTSTQHAILNLSTHLTNACNSQLYSPALFLDIHRAFDTVWHDGLVKKLHDINLPLYLVKLLQHYLHNRTASVKVNSTFSQPITLGAGVPQGAILSPILFNIFCHDIPAPPQTAGHLQQFADDTVLWTSHRQPARAIATLQDASNKLEKWMRKWRVKPNPQKSQLIGFRHPSTQRFRGTQLTTHLWNENIPETRRITYLGIQLSHTLNPLPTISQTIRRARQRLNLIIRLRTSLGGCHPKTLFHTYKTFIRPVLTYPSIILSIASQYTVQRIHSFERNAIRKILKLHYRHPSENLHDLASLPKIPDFIHKLQGRHATKTFSLNHHTRTL